MTWCKDTARDAAVRAEVEHLRSLSHDHYQEFEDLVAIVGRINARLERLEAMIPKTGSASSTVDHENKEDGMATKRDVQAADYRAEAIARPFAGAAERSSTVSETGEAQSGTRTERVTLDITYKPLDWYPPKTWQWSALLLARCKSVRVVEESVGSVDDRAYADRMACDEERDFANRMMDQRDAAIRERDEIRQSWLRSEESGTRLLAQRNAALDDADALRKRVAELEAASGGGEGEPVAWAVRYPTGRIGSSFDRKEQAEGLARDQSLYELTVVPLYRSPPPPRGWLTERDRKTLIDAAVFLSGKGERGMSDAIEWLLARSTPPEVRLVRHLNYFDCHGDRVNAFDAADVLAALAAAGVAVKEVGRE